MTAVALLQGRARVVGDDVNSDYIIASRRKRETLDERALARFLLETIDPHFAASVMPNDILVAGRNFGGGSAMEVAATVILAGGIRAVVATSFARSFYRNAVNNGLLPVECDTSGIAEGDDLIITPRDLSMEITNVTRGIVIRGAALPAIMADILHAGGLVGYIRRHGGFRDPRPHAIGH